MATTSTARVLCPKCAYERPDGCVECARCGIVFDKFRPQSMVPVSSPPASSDRGAPLFVAAKARLIDSDDRADVMTLVGRVGLYFSLLWWGWQFMTTPLENNYPGESFLHLINLPFHEAGHLVFMPFGRFMMFLGGSLGQILMPLVCLGTFLLKTRDPFGGSVALWWTAENFMDVAPYINDARALDLMLLGGVTGKETDGHDWEYILSMLGWLPYDHRLAHLSYNIGILLMFMALAWGGLLLWKHFRRLSA